MEDKLNKLDSDSLLRVCLCEKTCLDHISLKGLLESGYKGVLFVENEEGEFVKVTVDMLGNIPRETDRG